MKLDQINYLNIWLMFASALAAFLFPFELFLFSYFILGPLHYLTEILWLHKQDYYARKRVLIGWLLLAFLLMYPAALIFPALWSYNAAFLVAAFVAAYAIQPTAHRQAWIGAAVLTAGLFALMFWVEPARYWLAVAGLLLPTLIHVYLFTGSFLLFGALKGKSRSGYLALGVFAVCSLSFVLFMPEAPFVFRWPSLYAPFIELNAWLLQVFGQDVGGLFDSRIGLAVMRFIAFAYTYHYLNWFSKTTIIRWHEVPRSRLIFLLALWVAILAVYSVDYLVGFSIAYFLSLLHVLLEFPLNHKTFHSIFQEARLRLPRLGGWGKT